MINDIFRALTVGQPWPPATEKVRIERYQQETWLRDSKYSLLWSDRWGYIKGDPASQVNIGPNFPLLATKKVADTMLYQPPTFTCEYETTQDELNDYLDLINIDDILQKAVWDMSSHGHAIMAITGDMDEPTVKVIPPHNWFSLDSDKNMIVDIYNTAENRRTLQCTLYMGDIIIAVAVTLEGTIAGTWSISSVSEPMILTLPQSMNMVYVAHNCASSEDLIGKSDYTDDIFYMMKSLAMRYRHRSSILSRHADPSVIGPLEYMVNDPITGEPVFKSGGRYFPYESVLEQKAPEMKYLTWDGQLSAVENEISDLAMALLKVLELPPVALANDLAAASSGTALRLQMSPLLMKAARFRTSLNAVLPRMLQDALYLRGYDTGRIKITWRDGLPIDPMEEAQRLELLTRSMIYSPEQSLAELGHNDTKIQEIITDNAAKIL
jgi:hypothetical protein